MIEYFKEIGAYDPTRAHDDDAGWDIRVPGSRERTFTVPAHGGLEIDTKLHIRVPKGRAGMIKSKSGLYMKHNLRCEGVVDSGYSGPIKVKIFNDGDEDYIFRGGDKLTQIVLAMIDTDMMVERDSLWDSERGANGFGSTGKA